MADNVQVSSGTGTSIAADEVVDSTLGIVKVQYVKIMDGALDGTTKLGVGPNGMKVDGSAVTQPISNTNLDVALSTRLKPSDTLSKVTTVDTITNPITNVPISNLLGVTATGVTGAAVTLTLPAVVGQFHYIDSIEVSLYSTAARTGVATPILVTTTNLPGNPVSTWATSAVIGACDTRQLNDATLSIKSLVANTATTFVTPVVTGGLWRMNVIYNASV